MKILKNNLLLIFIVSFFLVSYSTIHKEKYKKETVISFKQEFKEVNDSLLQKSKKGKKPRRINDNTPRGRRERNRYKCQFEIATGSNEFSYFNKNKLDEITLRIPLSNDKFRLYRSYNISHKNKKGILLILTDDTQDTASGTPSHILDTVISTKNLYNYKNKKPLSLKSKDELTVFILNENRTDFFKDSLRYLKREYKALKKGKFEFCNKARFDKVILPDQKGGGVILEDEDDK